MLAGMYRAWRLLDEEDDLRMAILTGQGDVFCAGADFKSMGAGEMDEEFMKLMSEIPDIHWQALLRHNRPMQPIVAAGEGSAVAGGTETLLGTDIRDAAEEAVFEITEARKIAATICENAPRRCARSCGCCARWAKVPARPLRKSSKSAAPSSAPATRAKA